MSSSATSLRQRGALILSVLVSLVIVVYLFAKLDWAEVGRQLKLINLWYLPPLLLVFFSLLYMRALRWRLLLPGGQHLSLGRVFDATVIGFFASTILPLRAGEIIRPWILSRWQPVSFTASLASILIERLADAICLLSLLMLCLTQVSNVPGVVVAGAKAMGILCGVLVFIVLLSYIFPVRMEQIFHRICSAIAGRIAPKLAGKLNEMISEYFIGVRVIASWWQLAKVIFYSYAMWISIGFFYQLLLWSFGIFPSLWVGMMLNVIISLAVAAPSAPGFVGTFQLGCIITLSTVYAYSKEFAMAYSVVAHVLQMVLIVATGLFVLQARGLSVRQLKKME